MEGSENSQFIKRELIDWVERYQERLLENWELCRQGQHPRTID